MMTTSSSRKINNVDEFACFDVPCVGLIFLCNVAAQHPDVVRRLAGALDDASLYYATVSLDPALLEAKYRRIDNASWAGFQAPCYAPV